MPGGRLGLSGWVRKFYRAGKSLMSPGSKYFHYDGYRILIRLMQLTGGGPDSFEAISKGHVHNLQKYIGLRPDMSILEIGCGIGRDAIPLCSILSDSGRYLGIDIIASSIEWCSNSVSIRHPNFQFVHFDVKDQLHNPKGKITTPDIHIPLENHTVDLVILQSVFTHMFPDDVRHYLMEFHRVLHSQGAIYATLFLYDEEILTSARKTNLTPFNLRFEYQTERGVRINDPAHPAGAVAYSSESFLELCKPAGLELARPFLKGGWSGYYVDPEDGQDVAILRKVPNSHP